MNMKIYSIETVTGQHILHDRPELVQFVLVDEYVNASVAAM